jgi:hypothetical protein
MSIDRRYVYVNIYNKGMIPEILKKGPIFGMGMKNRFYEQLKMNPNVIIYTVEEDNELRSRGIIPGQEILPQPQKQTAQTNQVSKPEPASGIAEKTLPFSEIDQEIAKRAGELPEFDDQDIRLSDSDMAEIREAITSRVYTRYELGDFSNAKLKYILNVERKNKPGSKYYGAFHDRKPKLIDYILATQAPIPEDKSKDKQGE